MKKLIFLTCLASGAISSSALAQGGAREASVSPAGPRAELRLGFENTVAAVGVSDGVTGVVREGQQNGITFAGELGYDFRLGGRVLVGGYGGLDFSSVARCEGVGGGNDACLEADRTITAGARIGFQPIRNMLLYVKGGYSRTRLTFSVGAGENDPNRASAAEHANGFHLGGGVEYALSRRFYGRLEYIYSEYEPVRTTLEGARVAADMYREQVLIGFGIRF